MDIANFISNVGFPIAACIYLALHSVQQEKMHKEEIDKLSSAVNNQSEAIKANNEIVEQNTEVMKEMLLHLRGRKLNEESN